MLAEAEATVEMSVFRFYADPAGMAVISALMAAARRVVKVRLIIDGSLNLSQLDD
ncbi:MAG: hypothetical protein PHR37_04240 [Eubacteriales bacterium]|nr:hypothetical protein [Eubacteriales bacterium]MDD4324026.1 hypothetical protein [Eubacteriales bacterium]